MPKCILDNFQFEGMDIEAWTDDWKSSITQIKLEVPYVCILK